MRASLNEAQQSLGEIGEVLSHFADGDDGVPAPLSESAVRAIPRWHFAMLNDLERNDAFATALERVVLPGSFVLDIGSGTGLLAMMAARAGADSVITCEANPVLAEMTREIVARHGLSDVITVIPRFSTDLRVGIDLPRPADLIVSEIVDCGLVGEGILPTIRHARRELLVPGGRLLPKSARIMGALVESEVVDGLNRVRTAAGFDVGLLNEVATKGHFPVRLSTRPHRMLSAPVELAAFDFETDLLADGHAELDIPVSAAGEAHVLVAWFEMTLTEGVVMRNSPDNLSSHWMQACIPFAEPVPVGRGETARVRFSWQRDRLAVHTEHS